MNKKTIASLLMITIVSLLLGFIYIIKIKINEQTAITEQLKTIPKFDCLTLENRIFTDANIKLNTKTIFIYFNSDCDLCQNETQSIADNLESFKNVQFIFVSTEPIATIQKFSEQYNMTNLSNITFLFDGNDIFFKKFHITSIPSTLMYDKNGKLLKKHKGQLNAKGIIRALQQNE